MSRIGPDEDWIGVDLDGTLALYTGWHGLNHIGEPIPIMVKRVKQWLAEGKNVRIMTARVARSPSRPAEEDVEITRAAVKAWCLKHIGAELEVTNQKDFSMLELWDDRAVQVIPNTGLRADNEP